MTPFGARLRELRAQREVTLKDLAAALQVSPAYLSATSIAKAECWWLPGANTFRFVIRNIPREANLVGIRYRVWLRKKIPASAGIGVGTVLDTDLAKGDRIILPGRQDLPIVCFRLEDKGATLNLIVTDKMGNDLNSHQLDDSSHVMIEFSARARTWMIFKHEIMRLYAIPQFRGHGRQRRNIYRDDLLPIQLSHEQQIKSIREYADEVTVTV